MYYQSVGTDALSAEPMKSLLALHIQPPGLNALYALTLAMPGEFDLSLQMLFFLLGVLTVVLLVMSLVLLGINNWVSLGAGLIFAVLPSTVLYSLWPYNTSLVAFFVSLCLFGMALASRHAMAGSATFVFGVVAVFYTRPSLFWVVAVAAVFYPVAVGPRQLRRKLASLSVLGSILIIGLQTYHLAAFGSWTTSSWTGQTVLKGLIWSGQVTTDDVRAVAGDDPCLASLARDLDFWGSIESVDPSCFESRLVPFGDALAFEDRFKSDARYPQLNSIRHLELAPAWRALAIEVVKAHPLAFAQMVLGVGPGKTSFELSLQPGHEFAPLNENLVAGTPLLSLSRPLGTLIPVGSIAIILLVGGSIIVTRRNRWAEFPTFVAASCFVFHGLLTSALPEFGENNRFVVEVYPALIVGAAIALSVTFRSLKAFPVGTHPPSKET